MSRSKQFEIGVREVREITVWPLSMADEVKFSERLIGVVEGYDNLVRPEMPDITDKSLEELAESFVSGATNVQIAQYVVKGIKDNLIELLKYVSDDKVTLKDLTNEQFVDLCDLIYEMNFSGAMGKFKGLLNKVRNAFPSQQKTQLPNSSSAPVTDTNTSTDSDTETEE